MTEVAGLVAAGLAALAALMAALWLVHLAIRNAAIVDAGWAAGLPLLAWWYTWRLHSGARGALLAALVTIWGVRLTWHLLADRVIGRSEDGRYVELRRRWRTHLRARFFALFEAQALLDVVLSLPVLLAARAGGSPGLVEAAAVALWAAALTGEALADRQLARFRRDPAHRGRVCDTGLWRWSRHPNYFFEWLIWISYALYSTAVPVGWLGWVAPAIMLFFLFRVTGIPETEAEALRTRGDAYRRYQATTRVFVPWPRKGRAS